MTLTEDSRIIAPPTATLDQCRAFMLRRPHGEYRDSDITDTILPAYFAVCQGVGVNPAIAVAQMIHETGNLTSYWAQRPRRNPAGIGVNGIPGVGLSFASWQESVAAHVGRLIAYATTPEMRAPAQFALAATALTYRALPVAFQGTAPRLKALGKAHNPKGKEGCGWASPGDRYGAAIAALANQIRGL